MLKQIAKRIIKGTYRRVKWALPGRVRSEVQQYAEFRRRRNAPPPKPAPPPSKPYTLPYWERREQFQGGGDLVRIGFVGAGDYAQHHLLALSSLKQAKITSILTTGGPRAQEAATKYNIPKIFKNEDEFLGQSDFDCLVVVVPAKHLHSVALKCLSTGKPVLMEKPAGATAAETAELMYQAAEYNTYGMVGMNRRFYSVLEHGLARLADCGAIRGAILEIPQPITAERQSKRLTEWDYDHFMVRNSIHGLDLVRYVLGDPTQVHSLAWPNWEYRNAAASFASILEYERGMVATVTDLWDTLQSWRLKVVAETGWVEFDPFERGWFVDGGRNRHPIKVDPVDVEFRTGIYAQDLCFVEAVRAGKKPGRPACLLPDAYKTMVLIEQIMNSSISKQPAAPGSAVPQLLNDAA